MEEQVEIEKSEKKSLLNGVGFKMKTSEKLERMFIYALFIVHGATLIEFCIARLQGLAPEGLLSVAYIVLCSVIWCTFFYYRAEEAEIEAERNKIEYDTKCAEFSEQLKLLEKHRGYSEAHKDFRHGFSVIHEMQRHYANVDSTDPQILNNIMDDMIVDFQAACNHFSAGFRKIVQCNDDSLSICIKYVNQKESTETSIVRTLVRDSRSESDRHFDEGSIHVIHKNTAYLFVFKNIRKNIKGHCFFNNDLPLLRGYENTSFANYGQEQYKPDASDEYRIANWKMPYRSTIVAGICPNVEHKKQSKNIIGYVCIDAKQANAFVEDKDLDLMIGFADGLFNTMRVYQNLLSKAATAKKTKVHAGK